ncbi:MAG: hypothetical protein ACK5AQ_01715, partial [Bacteroidota bacterium]
NLFDLLDEELGPILNPLGIIVKQNLAHIPFGFVEGIILNPLFIRLPSHFGFSSTSLVHRSSDGLNFSHKSLKKSYKFKSLQNS